MEPSPATLWLAAVWQGPSYKVNVEIDLYIYPLLIPIGWITYCSSIKIISLEVQTNLFVVPAPTEEPEAIVG